MRYCLTADQYEALYDELEQREITRQRDLWILEGGSEADFRPSHMYPIIARQIEQVEREWADAVAECRYDMQRMYALN